MGLESYYVKSKRRIVSVRLVDSPHAWWEVQTMSRLNFVKSLLAFVAFVGFALVPVRAFAQHGGGHGGGGGGFHGGGGGGFHGSAGGGGFSHEGGGVSRSGSYGGAA